MTLYQKLAAGALASVLLLICVGAIVRVSGSGMGCPDWPTCWGCLIPPTKIEQVDFKKLPIEKFRHKAERMGRDPATITEESLRREFNPRHVWTEFLNRMTSMPVGLFTLATFIASFWQRSKRPLVFWMSFGAFFSVLLNGWIGATVVYSGLKPVVLTTHLALAMALTVMLVYCMWRGTDDPWHIEPRSDSPAKAKLAVLLLLGLIVGEGILGSQVREMATELGKAGGVPRESWIGALEHQWIYLVHRSFSWAVVGAAVWAWMLARRKSEQVGLTVERVVTGIVLTQMILGVIMARIHLYEWVQVLHVGLAATLLAFTALWAFGLTKLQRT